MLTISSVAAGDINKTNEFQDKQEITIEDIDLDENQDEKLKSDSEEEKLEEGQGTFTDLKNDIDNAEGEIKLNRDYSFNESSDNDYKNGIKITADNFVVDGQGHTLRGGATARIFEISGNNVILKNLGLNDGYAAYGAAIFAHKNITLINCTFEWNSGIGAALYTSEDSIATVENSTFNNNRNRGNALSFGSNATVINSKFVNNYVINGTGGTIESRHTCEYITIRDCVFLGNEIGNNNPSLGGAIFVGVDGIVINCTFSGNKAKQGAAIYFNQSGSVYDSKFEDNYGTEIGGAIFFKNQGYVFNSTFNRNNAKAGGAVYFFDNGNVTNSTFRNNLATGTANPYHDGGAIYFEKNGTVKDSKFINNHAEYNGGAISIRNGSIINSNFTGDNAKNEGGAISIWENVTIKDSNFLNCTSSSPDSLIIDLKDGGTLSTENVTPKHLLPLNFRTLTDEIKNCDKYYELDGDCVFSLKYDHPYKEGIVIDKEDFVFDGAGYKVDGRKIARILQVSGKNVTIKNVIFINGYSNESGGAIYSLENITLENCTFINNTLRDNTESNNGGAIYSKGAISLKDANFTQNIARIGGAIYCELDVTMNNCSFTDNNATAQGGAVYTANNLMADNCSFIHNVASDGGAIFSSQNTISNSIFKDNSASSLGGAIMSNGEMTAENLELINNSAADGGAIYCSENSNVKNSNFTNNVASQTAGGVFFKTSGKVYDSIFINNTAINDGAAIFFTKSSEANNSIFINNSANGAGGAIGNREESITVSNTQFIGNLAENGGAIFSNDGTVNNCNFTNNTARENGGGIFGHDVTVHNSKFDMNRANGKKIIGKGGAILIYDGRISNSEFNNNYADDYSGAIQIDNCGSIDNCNFTNNSAANAGAAYLPNGTISNSLFVNNTAKENGGAICISDNGGTYIFNSTFITSNAGNEGGAIFANGFCTMNNVTFIGNEASYGAAAYTKYVMINESSFINNTAYDTILTLSNGNIVNSKFINNKGNDSGTIYSSGYIEIRDSLFDNNSATNEGGVLYAGENASIYNSNFTNNKAEYGGAIAIYGNLYIVESKFENNSAKGTTFNIYLKDDANLTTVYENPTYLIPGFSLLNDDITKADGDYLNLTKDYIFDELTDDASLGLGVKIQKSDFILDGQGHTINGANLARIFNILRQTNNVTLKNINFVNGFSSDYGGALYLDTSVSVDNCNFTNFTAYDNGGAIYFANAQNEGIVINSNFKNVSTGEDGGAIYFRGNGSVKNSTFADASALENGGGIYFKSNGTVIDCDFNNTKAKQGASIYFKNNGNISGSSFINGNAEFYGGAIYSFESLTVDNCEFIKNNAKKGGAIYNCSDLNISNSIFENNTEIPETREITSIEYQDMNTTTVDSAIDGRVGEYFRVTLKDKNGKGLANKLVQIGFNGMIYDSITDEKGVAELQINLKYSGIYTFAVAYLGDDKYNGSFIVAKITVNKQKGSLTVPAKSYKANAKTKLLTATFKAKSGKVVANKKVSFTVNGKTYSTKTNEKGVASVKVSISKKGTYTFAAKFAGDSTYEAMTKKAKLTIK